MNRREFLLKTGAVTAGCMVGGLLDGRLYAAAAGSSRIALICDRSDPVASATPAQWAAGELHRALTARGLIVHRCASVQEAGPDDFCLIAAGGRSSYARAAGVTVPPAPEALAIAPGRLGGRPALLACGHDTRGLVYALTEIADAVALAEAPAAVLHPTEAVAERPAHPVRSVMRLFVSNVEDKPWYNDRDFWRRYLSMLAAQRFNRINLAFGLGYDSPSHLRDTYFYFAYPFLVDVPGYHVRAVHLPDAERDANLAMLRFISDEAAARGLDFQLGLWTHAYRWHDSPHVNYVIDGLTPQTQAPYCRDALALVLKECPNITGVTFRIHGESGVPEGSYGLWRTIFDGCVLSSRRVVLDMHAKGIDQPTINAALSTKLPITISPKFWAEHLGLPYQQAAIRALELPKRKKGPGLFAESEGARSFLRYGYGDLLKEGRPYQLYFRVWPGTQRVLLWGDPTFAAAYSRAFGFCGCRGGEWIEPLSFRGRKGSGLPGGRDGYVDDSWRSPGGDVEKYRYTYRLYGRMLYNPDTRPEVWRRELRHDYGAAAAPAEAAMAHASRILPLFTTAHLPSAANNLYWPEMYANMSIGDASHPEPYFDTPSPKRFGYVSPIDPQMFSRIEDFADELIRDEVRGKYDPVEVAQWLEDLARTAASHLTWAQAAGADRTTPIFRRFAVDVAVQAGLGRFFGAKLRAGVLYALFERTGDRTALAEAVKAYRQARMHWAEVAHLTAGVYVRDLTYGPVWYQRGDWADRLPAIDKDIVLMAKAVAPADARPIAPERMAALLRAVTGRPQRSVGTATHKPPSSFHRGRAVNLMIVPGSPAREVRLLYRHTQQAEAWQSVTMSQSAGTFTATIPSDYTDTPYPLEYYFEIIDGPGRAGLYPGLGPKLDRQPYFVVRS